jgi:hypothetical protein
MQDHFDCWKQTLWQGEAEKIAMAKKAKLFDGMTGPAQPCVKHLASQYRWCRGPMNLS